MNEKTIKISQEAYEKLLKIKKEKGIMIKFSTELAINNFYNRIFKEE